MIYKVSCSGFDLLLPMVLSVVFNPDLSILITDGKTHVVFSNVHTPFEKDNLILHSACSKYEQ